MDTNIQALLKVGEAQGWKILVFLSKASQSMDAAGKLQDQSIESSIIKKKIHVCICELGQGNLP